MIDKTISHYKILEKLGSGSMGTVYKAEDTKLKRIVALKFLPPHLITGKTEKRRFLHEARAASALNHTNIITIYDIVDEIDKIFIVMEYCAGKMLTEKLKDGPLKQRELLDIAIDVAEGLNAAHKDDITHRDIKSQNIIISDDCPPKIIDFGIAKQIGMTDITKDGTTLGTQCYMSPEQLHGSKVDKRSDIFSFGVVLYEMATGKLPFTGKHDAEILYSVVNEDPIPITTLNPNMDEELQRIVSKAMKKNVKDRYQHIDDMLADLRNLKKKHPKKHTRKQSWWRVPAYSAGLLLIVILLYTFILKKDTRLTDHTIGKKSIAVLPFTTIDRTEESEIFGEGIHDDILTQIAKIHDLKVIARTSVIKYKDSELGLKDIAKELNVTSILEGSVRRAGDKIRIVAQLIDPLTEDHIWAETYDRDYSDIFAIQSEVAQKIAFALETTLSPKEKRYIEEIPTDNFEAYDWYIKGKFDKSQANRIKYFEQALELDPNFALAYVELSMAQLQLGWESNQYVSNELREKAKLSLEKAIELDPLNPKILQLEGYYYYYGFRDYEKALKKYSLALKSRPNDSELFSAISYVKRRQGNWDEALELGLNAVAIDPLDYDIITEVAGTALFMRKWELAKSLTKRSLTINPKKYDSIEDDVIRAVNQNGDLMEAQSILDEAANHISADTLRLLLSDINFLNKNYANALKISKGYHNSARIEDISDYLNSLNKGIYALFNEEIELSNSYFDSLIIFCKNKIKLMPDDYQSYQWLARAYAHSGNKDGALSTIYIVDKLILKDAIVNSKWRNHKSLIYIAVGEYDKALAEIEYLLLIPSTLSVERLKLDPLYDPLRDNPRFQKLIKKYKYTEG
ncbi:protein kinase [Candidatus Neomarinimicrobiota bacterium]